MVVDGDTCATIRAKTLLLKTILQVAVPQGWLTDNVVDPARLPKAVEQPDEDRVITPEVRRLLNKLIWNRPATPTEVLGWSLWRRRHEARARRFHYASGGASP